GGIGRRARFRFVCLRAWGFNSPFLQKKELKQSCRRPHGRNSNTGSVAAGNAGETTQGET
ncbi:MAG: hypothetical protein KAR20_26340, partial [Candidatus Heimdallarchaeota archaeon]|nr:hypothetical protein [Candidatus Heimdallarchaeota archaeon]